MLLSVLAPPLLFLPIEIHSVNLYDFQAALPDLRSWLVILSLAPVIAGALVMMAAPERWFQALVALLLAIAFIVWIQGQFLVWDYGVLDGRAIDWRSNPARDATDAALLIMISTGAVLARRWLFEHAILIAIALLLVQAAPAIWAVRSTPPTPDIHRFSFDETHKYSFSEDRNVIVVVLDAFQADVFQEILDQEPEWAEVFDGFTYFRNALAGYAKTYPTFALMLTGRWYENELPIQDFIERSFTRDSITRVLMRRGWRVDLFPHIKRIIHPSPRIASNVVPVIAPKVTAEEAGRLADLGLFRVTPHRMKRFWINDYQWRLAPLMTGWAERADSRVDTADGSQQAASRHPHGAVRFVSELEVVGRADLRMPAFKMYHLMIPHAPFNLDRSLELADLPPGNDGFVQQSYASLEITKRLIARMKSLGIYDDTLLFVISDHGGGEYRSHVYLEGVGMTAPDEALANDDIPGPHLTSGLPLVLVKPFHSRGVLEISDAPVSLADLARTIAETLGLEGTYPERNLFEISARETRTRRYLHFGFEGWDRVYLPKMIEYRVDGFSWLRDSWQSTGRVFAPGEELSAGAAQPRIIDRHFLHFRPGSPFLDGLLDGWSEPSPNGLVWSTSRSAAVEFALPADLYGDISASFDLQPFTARGRITAPRVELKVNDRLRHEWVAEGRGWYEVDIPESVIRGRDTIRFELRFPDAASPADFGYSNDRRTLGIALYGVRIESAARDDMP